MLKRILAVAGLIVVSGCSATAAPTTAAAVSKSAASAAPAPHAVGQSISYTSSNAAGTVTVTTAKWVTTAPMAAAFGPPKNGACLVLDVTWTGTGQYNGARFRVPRPHGAVQQSLHGMRRVHARTINW